VRKLNKRWQEPLLYGSPVKQSDGEGGTRTKEPEEYQSLTANVQPVTDAAVLAQYGKDVDELYEAYIDVPCPVKKGDYIRYRERTYRVQETPTWKHHTAVLFGRRA
jgi:hypothetical protein